MTLPDAIQMLQFNLACLKLAPLTDEQIDCLNDPTRYDEALDMVDDLECRCGINSHIRAEIADILTQRELAH